MSKYLMNFDLIAKTHIHIGRGWEENICDASLYRDSSGEVVIPGTSLSGILRSGAEEFFKDTEYEKYIEQLFGAKTINSKSEKYQSSRIKVRTAKLKDDTYFYIRNGIKINELTGVADSVQSAMFDFETLSPQSKFKVQMELNTYINELEEETSAELDEKLPQMVAVLLRLIQEGYINIGGGSSRGLGRFQVKKIMCYKYPPIGSMAFFEMLLEDNWAEYLSRHKKDFLIEGWQKSCLERIEINKYTKAVKLTGIVQFTGYFLTKDSMLQLRTGWDAYPASYFNDKNNSWKRYIPGSTFRGVIRKRANDILEKIVSEEGLRKKLKKELFGCESECSNSEEENQGSKLKIFDLIQSTENQLKGQARDFIAIDRFAGGTINGAKYDALALYKPEYKFEIILHEYQDWEIGLILFVLRDMQAERCRLGYGKSKGFGLFTLKEIKLNDEQTIDFSNGVALQKYIDALQKEVNSIKGAR